MAVFIKKRPKRLFKGIVRIQGSSGRWITIKNETKNRTISLHIELIDDTDINEHIKEVLREIGMDNVDGWNDSNSFNVLG